VTSSTPYRLSVLVLAGGQSRRMGRDKARLVVQGEPLILRVVRRVKRVADEVLVVSRWPHEYAFTGVACVPDVLPGQGPLAGIWSGALVAAGRYIAPVACDMPFVNPELLQAMVNALRIFVVEKPGRVWRAFSRWKKNAPTLSMACTTGRLS